MSLSIRPLLSALRRNPTGAFLVALQVAITLAVLVNAAWIVSRRIKQVEQPVGINTRDTFGVMIMGLSKAFHIERAESEDIAYVRALPGVLSATVTGGIPLTGDGDTNTSLWSKPDQQGATVSANVLQGGSQLLRTLDVPLTAGRNFRRDEIQPFAAGKPTSPVSVIIVTQALAHALFPRGAALGKTLYNSKSDPLTIIGITRNFVGDRYEFQPHAYDTVLFPTTPGLAGFYSLLIRTRSGMRNTVLRETKAHIGASHHQSVILRTVTLASAKNSFESKNRTLALFLTAVTALMLAVCALGIFGLTTFNVGSRTRQIGTRRAVGARKRDVVTHFMLENALILTAGALLGSALALALGDWLTAHYGLPRLALSYLFAGIVLLWIIGELAAWQPARRAARVSPSVATRTV